MDSGGLVPLQAQPGGFDFGAHIGQHVLDGLMLGNWPAKGLALFSITNGFIQRGLGQPHGHCANADAATVEGGQGLLQAPARLAEQILAGNADVIKGEHMGGRAFQAHLFFGGIDGQAGPIGLNDD